MSLSSFNGTINVSFRHIDYLTVTYKVALFTSKFMKCRSKYFPYGFTDNEYQSVVERVIYHSKHFKNIAIRSVNVVKPTHTTVSLISDNEDEEELPSLRRVMRRR